MKIPCQIQAKLPKNEFRPTPAEAAVASKVSDLQSNDRLMEAYEAPGRNWVAQAAVHEMRSLVQDKLYEPEPLDLALELQRSTLDAAASPMHGTVGQLFVKIARPLLEAYPTQHMAQQLLSAGKHATKGPEHDMFLAAEELTLAGWGDEAAVTMANLSLDAIQKGSMTVRDVKNIATQGTLKDADPYNQAGILNKALLIFCHQTAEAAEAPFPMTAAQQKAADQAFQGLTASHVYGDVPELQKALDSIPN